MSRRLVCSIMELRTPITRLPPAFLLPLLTRGFKTTSTTTSTIVDPVPQPDTTTAKAPNAPHAPRRPPQPPSQSPPAPLSQSVRSLLPLLRAQPAHFVTVHIHARPYLVTEGDAIRLPFRMPGVLPGDVLRLTRASVVGSRDLALRGAPYVDDRLFECRATVLGVESEPMRLKVKKKQRNRRTKTVKSKHRYTVLRVSELKIKDIDEVEGRAETASECSIPRVESRGEPRDE